MPYLIPAPRALPWAVELGPYGARKVAKGPSPWNRKGTKELAPTGLSFTVPSRIDAAGTPGRHARAFSFPGREILVQ